MRQVKQVNWLTLLAMVAAVGIGVSVWSASGSTLLDNDLVGQAPMKAEVVTDPGEILIEDEDVPLSGLPALGENAVLQGEEDPYEGLSDIQIQYVQIVVALVNDARAAEGLDPLILNPDLRRAAQVRAEECVTSFSHVRPDGSSYKTAITAAGVESNYTGENVATGYTTAKQVVQGWLSSKGHRANILNENFTQIGVGLEKNTGSRYGGYAWTQLFAR